MTMAVRRRRGLPRLHMYLHIQHVHTARIESRREHHEQVHMNHRYGLLNECHPCLSGLTL